MSKKDELIAAGQDNVKESMGANAADSATATATEPKPRAGKHEGVQRSKDVALIPISRIRPDPLQPRKDFDREELRILGQSLKTRGQLQPIRVRWDEPEKVYRIIIGERRFRAATEAGIELLECKIEEGEVDEPKLRAIQLIENLHRVDLSDIEKAKAMQGLIDAHGWSQRTLASELNLKQAAIAKTLALLTLAPEVQEKVDSGQIPSATGYQLSKVKDPKQQLEVAQQVVDGKLGRDETQALVESRVERPKRGKAAGGKTKAKKLKTDEVFNVSGYKFRVECRKGIVDKDLLAGLDQWVSRIRERSQGTPGMV